MTSTELEIMAHRDDGLGCRLSNLLNAWAVAERLGARFRFGWPAVASMDPDWQAVLPMTEIFSASFIRAYAAPDFEPRRYLRWVGNPLPLAVVRRAGAEPDCAGIHYRWWKPGAALVGESGDDPVGPAALRRAAQQIQFAPSILELRDQARKSLPSGAVVVHARRGDIVHGRDRIRLWNDKYAPLALVKAVIRHLRDSGVPTVLVSDDAATVELARSLGGVLSLDDLRPAACASRGVAAFFDMFLMAGCDMVISTVSGLSTYAALAAGTKVIHLFDYFSKLAAMNAIRADLAAAPEEYSALDRIKAKQYVALELGDAISAEERFRTLAEVADEDPDNPTYAQLHAVALLRQGNPKEAERLLAAAAEQLLARGVAASGELAEYVHGLELDGGYAVLAEHAGPEWPFITAHVSRRRLAKGDVGQAIALAETALRANPTHAVLLIQCARTLQAGGQHPRARALLERLRSLAPGLPAVLGLDDAAMCTGKERS